MRGFALIEVLVATGVVAAGLLALAQLMAAAVAANTAARHDTVASMLAAQKVEELRTSGVPTPIDSIEHVDPWGRVIGTGESPPLGATHTRRWTIRPSPSGPPRLVVIDVTVEPLANTRGDTDGRRRGLVRVSTATSLITP